MDRCATDPRSWTPSARFGLTSGVYYFGSHRNNDFGVFDRTSQGRAVRPVDYGLVGPVFLFLDTEFAVLGPHVDIGDVALGTVAIGVWGGDPDGQLYRQRNSVDVDAVAAFGQGTWQIDERWALTLGARWAQDEKKAREQRAIYFEAPGCLDYFVGGYPVPGVGQINLDFFGVGPNTLPGGTGLAGMNILMGNALPNYEDAEAPITPVCALDDPDCVTPLRMGGLPISVSDAVGGSDDWSDVTWRVNLDWTPDRDTLVYLSATTGYRAGGYALGAVGGRDVVRDPRTGQPVPGSALVPLTYDEETVLAYELGYKGLLRDGRLELFASLYHYDYDYDGYQDLLNVFDPLRGEAVEVVQNAGGAENSGIELELQWAPVDPLRIGGHYSYTRTRYADDYVVLDLNNPAVPPGVFGSANVAPELYSVNVKGNSLKRIPEHKATLWGTWTWNFAPGSLAAHALWAYTGEFQAQAFDRRLDRVPDHTRVDASLLWRDQHDRVTVRGFVDNVFDSIGVYGLTADGENQNFRLLGARVSPRIVGLDVALRFGGR